jgi:2'-5' RNA ligase
LHSGDKLAEHEKPLRLFVALELPAEVIAALAATQQQVQRGGKHPVKWVKPASIHLTLQFLGAVNAEQLPFILTALDSVHDSLRAAGDDAALLHLAEVGAFPNARRPQTLWVGVAGALAGLHRAQQAVVAALEPPGFAAEERPFRPHLTLGRVRKEARPAERASLGAVLAGIPAPQPVRWPMGLPYLFESTLSPAGPTYIKQTRMNI